MKDIKKFQQMFRDGRMNRRDFLAAMGALGFTATTAGGLLTSASALAETPKKGGRLRFAWDQHGPADTLDPALNTATIDYVRGRCYYNRLTQFNPDLSLRGDLAEEWSVNSNATEFTFKLRKGVTFHDGADFTADDALYAMNRHLGADSISKASSLVSMVSEWKKIDKYTIKAILSSPNADLASILGTFHFNIVQNGAEGEYFQKPNATGPFTVEEFVPGVRSVGKRNPNYFRDGPYLDEVETFAITDAVARTNALVAGDIQICGNLDPKAIKQIEGNNGTEIYMVPSGGYPTICVMRDRHPGDNLDFVLALKYLQRREKILKGIFKGMGTMGNDHPIGSAYLKHCADLPQRPFDPDKAKFHLQKSGITEAEIHVAEIKGGITDMCLLLQREASKIGLKLNVKRVPNDGYWGAVWMKQPIMVSSWNMRPTANVMLTLAFKSDAPWNEVHWKNERFDELLLASRAEADPAKSQELYCEMQKLVSDDGGNVIPLHAAYLDAISSKVKGMPKVPLAATGGGEWPEYAWIDS